jgi:uracil-DNA glycosylase family 4
MIQPEHQRRAYLEALGIEVWLPRDQPDPQQEDVAAAASRPDGLGWDDLRAAVAACTSCSLHTSRTQTVFGVGDPQADWMIIGEAPGAEEDRRGEPFVGRAGKLLDEMLRAVGQSRDRVFIANILKCRPPNNRDPKAEESAACRGYLQRQIELIQPKIILAVGRIAAQLLLETDEPVGRLRGSRHQLGDTPLVVTYHPAYLLRSPSQKRKAWDDLCLASHLMREASL